VILYSVIKNAESFISTGNAMVEDELSLKEKGKKVKEKLERNASGNRVFLARVALMVSGRWWCRKQAVGKQ
jgi:hypothetical protein